MAEAPGVPGPDRGGLREHVGQVTSAGEDPEPSTPVARALLAVVDHLELVAKLVRGRAAAQSGGDAGELEELLAALSRGSAALGDPRPLVLGRAEAAAAARQPGQGDQGEEAEAAGEKPSATADDDDDDRPPSLPPERDENGPPPVGKPTYVSMSSEVSFFGANRGAWIQRTESFRNPALQRMQQALASDWMECCSAVLIVINTMFMILEGQFVGAKIGHEVGVYAYYGSEKFFESSGALAPDVFFTIEVVFCVVFTAELLLKLVFLPSVLLCDWWGWLDIAVVLTTDITTFLIQGEAAGEAIPVSTIRVLRLARLLRIMKLARKITLFDSLYLMTTALRGSMNALIWVVAFLFLVQTLFALLLTNVVQEFYLAAGAKGDEFFQTAFEKQEVFKYFGTYWRAMVSLFELMLANWPPICRLMMESMSEIWSAFVVGYKLFMGVAVIGVIMGVFTQETFRAADIDDEVMIRRKATQARIHKTKMRALFQKMNKRSNGTDVDLALFENVLSSPDMRLWLKAMDYDVSDASLLFYLIDTNGDGTLTVDELIEGMASLKGGARNIDVQLLMRQSRVGRMAAQSSRSLGGVDAPRMSVADALRLVEARKR